MSIRLIAGDCRDVLPTLAADSVQCVVTSPPYYGLRDYGTALWDGGDAACDHSGRKNSREFAHRPGNGGEVFRSGSRYINQGEATGRVCSCGAVRIDRQIGLEATPDAYLATMVAVFREVRRVLRPDGTCWVNMGDSYAPNSVGVARGQEYHRHSVIKKSGLWKGTVLEKRDLGNVGNKLSTAGTKPKDLLLMPARLALALQADGWWVRSDIIWHKPNPMPESCTDRPTSSYEHVFLLTKSARYYYDADAVREEADPAYASRYNSPFNVGPKEANGAGRPGGYCNTAGMKEFTGTRNLRNVWTIATSPFSAAHFATYPPELAERCIRAGTSERGACSQCGKPWVRTQEVVRPSSWEARKAAGHPMSGYHAADGAIASRQQVDDNAAGGLGWVAEKRITGWAPGCKCEADVKPCVVLDPFFGAGTTGLVAERLQRDCIGIDLNPDYNVMSRARIEADAPLFTSFPPAEPPEDARMADLFAEAAE